MADENETIRLKWTNDQIKCFLESCIEEVNKLGRRGMSLHVESWTNVQKKLLEVCGMNVTQKQMRNLYDYLKGKYSGWVYLRGKTGNIYNPQTNMFNLSNQEWAEFIKGHPQARSLKTSPLAFPDLCIALFDGTAATGARHWAPSSSLPRNGGSSSQSSQKSHTLDVEDNSTDDDRGENGNKNGAAVTNLADPISKKKGKAPANKWSQLEENMSNALAAIVEGQKGASMKDCIDKLKTIGLEVTSPFYLAAFGIFGDSPAHREAWLMLDDDPEVLIAWIGTIGRKMGYLDFNMIFIFVVAGWEGVAHDSRVLSEAMVNPTIGFPFPPPDKYYLCDAAYTNTRGFMLPYRNVRYWLGDFRRRRAITRKEKFNHSHAKLRNVIERAYGVLKSRFAILKKMTTFSFDTQRDVVIACFAVHNFIRKEGFNDEYFAIADLDNLEVENINVQLHAGNYEVHPPVSASDQQFMVNLREKIAAQLMPNEE